MSRSTSASNTTIRSDIGKGGLNEVMREGGETLLDEDRESRSNDEVKAGIQE